MERRFFMNIFEQSLKEQADKFQMIPSKKVWHGIYNDLHPGKRWPSVTMSLLLIFSLVVIGHLNTNNSRKLAYSTNKISKEKNLTAEIKTTGGSTNYQKNNQRIAIRKTDLDKAREVFVYSTGQKGNTGSLTPATVSNYQHNNVKEDRLPADNSQPGHDPVSSSFEKNFAPGPQANSNAAEDIMAENVYNKNIYNKETRLQNNIELDRITNETKQGKIQEKIVSNHFDSSPLTKTTLTEKEDNSRSEDLSANKNPGDIISAKNTTGTQNKTAKFHKKRNDNVNWVYFAAPVVSSVSFDGDPLKQGPSTNFSPRTSGPQKKYQVLHNSALGFEAGAQINYTLSKKLKFTTGVHLTYSGYNIVSNQVHPISAVILVLKDPATNMTYLQSFESHYGDGTGQAVVTLRNYNWQASIPFGLHYEISGNSKIQFNLGADLEPSLVLKSNAFILSSDGNNYINDHDLLRKWNMSSNFGAFVTFSSRKFKWQIGPNIRYQWLSTYLKDYTVKEHLTDYGIRIGISK